ncbi:MAG: pyridoxal phosphate-dependent aminotransferase [Thermomicrobium sp.]|nr:pyridoxal phosphate-dependent aminotransferase [Thermomicrobium sp.]
MVQRTVIPSLSRRVLAIPPSPIRGLVPLADAAKARGVRVIHLNIGQPDLPPPPGVAATIAAAAAQRPTYTPSRGIPELITAWARYYQRVGLPIAPEHVVVTGGASEALWLAILATTDPGDQILVPEPFYAPYQGILTAAGVELVPVPAADRYGPVVPEAVRDRITPRTRGILLCSPANPTGTIYGEAALQELATLALEYSLFFYSDETYRELVFDGDRAPSALEVPGLERQVIVIDSVSKRFNACGLRIGALVSRNPDIVAAATALAELRLSLPLVAQLAGAAALDAPASYVAEVVATYRRRRDTILAALRRVPGVRPVPPAGALYLVAELPVDDTERFAAWLLTDFAVEGETVMVAPLSGFFATPGCGSRAVRIALVQPEPVLEHAVSLLATALERYPGRID